jgi:uncharacterized protein DUF4352
MSGYERPENGPYHQQYPTAPPPHPGGRKAPKSKLTIPVWLIATSVTLVTLCCIGGGIVLVVSLANSGSEVTPNDEVDPPAAADDTPAPAEETAPADQEPDRPEAMQIGDTGTYSEAGEEIGELTVTNAERFTDPRSEFGDPPDHDEFVLVTINAKAIGDDLYSVNPYDFHMRDSDGRQYENAGGSSLFAVDETLNAVDLNPDEQVTGDLVFDVPTGPLELVYAPGWSRALAYWEIP